ncbi:MULTISPECIES: CRISPR-associated helicase Cas3' [Aerococcus]|uniref:CRISPR-associated helicase Cas3' n=1 Tax=Aerococcus TaxID=1375 RepID=UPI000DCE6E28|nr:CRISPR-associated helicase Cas3' [Aerococcus urinae]RAV71466.1 hypothetical protein DBT40_03930 [Aerococcus urinae]RAW05177.1 hypothetical protein DBT41_04905 [Aerococcus urinae]
MLIAHKNEDGKVQELTDHLVNVADYCYQTGDKMNLGWTAFLAGILHDVGKSDILFQDYIQKGKKVRVNHSSAGGRVVDYLNKKVMPKNQIGYIYSQVLQYVIYAHHGLFDVIDLENPSTINMEKRFNYDEAGDYHFHSQVMPYCEELSELTRDKYGYSLEEIYQKGVAEFQVLWDRFKKMAQAMIKEDSNQTYAVNALHFYLHCLVRLILSILKEGDIYDSANWDQLELSEHRWDRQERTAIFNQAADCVEDQANYYGQFSGDSAINYWRTNFSNQLKDRSSDPTDSALQLSLPTGSGKTQAVLRYAVNRAKALGKDHVYYVTSFLSVLEQNAKEIESVLSGVEDAILEHHSNIVEEDGQENQQSQKYRQQQYLIDSWQAPFVLTTMVQFFQTMFKGKASQIRRFHQLGHSVIILDEVQSLPVKVLYPFNLMMNFLTEVMGTTVILCTATQPLLGDNSLDYPLQFKDSSSNLVPLDPEAQDAFQRIEALNYIDQTSKQRISTDELVALIKEDAEEFQSILLILNTKSAVNTLVQALEEYFDAESLYYLTTNMCAKHRLNQIEKIKEQMKVDHDQPIIVVSTQLIEAGVDLDFNVVYRSLAGIDSLVQAAGRCNRNAHLDKGFFKLIDYAEEDLTYLKEIKASQEAAGKVLRQEGINQLGQTFSLESLVASYYRNLYKNPPEDMNYTLEMKWPLKDQNVIDLLGWNDYVRRKSKESDKYIIAQAFNMVAKQFNLIDQETISVIVPYHNRDLLDQMRQAIDDYDFKQLKQLLKRLQPYTIQVNYSGKLQGKVEEYLDGEILVLLEEYYASDESGDALEIGLKEEGMESFIL